MADTLRIKRRAAGGAAGAPTSLAAAEIAYNEQDDVLYYGKGNSSGNATSVIPIAGPGFASGGATISDTPPSPSQGKLWWESDTGGFFISYTDADTTQWIAVNGQAAGGGGGLFEAPVDGHYYARKDAGWSDVSAAASGFTTGDAKITLKTVADSGWLMMNDGTIGSATSGATYADAAAQALFNLLFDNINDASAPIQTSAGGATTRAAQGTAAAAWSANCRMALTKQLGRALGIAGTGAGLSARALGSVVGTETTSTFINHNHTIGAAASVAAGGDFACIQNVGSTNLTGLSGGASSTPIVQPTTFWNVMIKL